MIFPRDKSHKTKPCPFHRKVQTAGNIYSPNPHTKRCLNNTSQANTLATRR